MDDNAPTPDSLPLPDATAPAGAPIVVDPSPVPDMLVTGMRQIVLVIGGATTLASMFRGRDVGGIGQYVMSNNFAIFMAALVTLATFAYGQLKTLWNKRRSVTMANASPDSVAIVQPKASLWTRFKGAF
jgi:hypothetical protein